MSTNEKLEHNSLWQKARAVDCPFCKAKAGEPCVFVTTESQEREMTVHHRGRYQAAGVVK